MSLSHQGTFILRNKSPLFFDSGHCVKKKGQLVLQEERNQSLECIEHSHWEWEVGEGSSQMHRSHTDWFSTMSGYYHTEDCGSSWRLLFRRLEANLCAPMCGTSALVKQQISLLCPISSKIPKDWHENGLTRFTHLQLHIEITDFRQFCTHSEQINLY